MPVSRISKEVGAGKVRYFDMDRPAWASDTVQFFHHGDNVVQMFEHVFCYDDVELADFERVGHHIQVVDNVRARPRIDVDRYRVRPTPNLPAADLQDLNVRRNSRQFRGAKARHRVYPVPK